MGNYTQNTSTINLIGQGVGQWGSYRVGGLNGEPILLGTDVVAGPASGGENDDGAYLTIFGVNFGSNINDLTVTIGGVPVASKIALVDARTHSSFGIKALSVQVGALVPLSVGTDHPIVVTNSNGDSIETYNFMIQPGNIIYVDSDVVTSGNGSFTTPYKYVQEDGSYTTEAWGDVGAGDFIVMRGSSDPANPQQYFAQGGGGASRADFCRIRYKTGTAPNGVAGNGYITIMGYPGEYVHCKPTAEHAPCFERSNNVTSDGQYIVLSNMFAEAANNTQTPTLDDSWSNGAIFCGSDGGNWRVVNVEAVYDSLSLPQSVGNDGPKGSCVGGSYQDGVLLFSNIHDGNGSQLNHCIYLDSTTDGMEVAYNWIHDSELGNLYQSFSSWGPALSNLSIHNNWFEDGGRYGINVSAATTDVDIYNNVIVDSRLAGLRFATNGACAMNFIFNSMYDVNGANGGGGERSAIITESGTITGEFKNNLIHAAANTLNGYLTISGGGMGGVSFGSNIYYGLSAGVPSQDSGSTEENMDWTDPANGDFSLQAVSPALAAATSTVLDIDRDINRVWRGSPADLGAREYVA